MTKKKTDIKKTSKPLDKKKSSSLKKLNENLKLEQDKYIRLFAEFENFKKRTAKIKTNNDLISLIIFFIFLYL